MQEYNFYVFDKVSGWFNGKTLISKIGNVGSTPTPGVFCIFYLNVVCITIYFYVMLKQSLYVLRYSYRILGTFHTG